jgi:ferredoxin
MVSGVRVRTDPEKCCSSGLCALSVPEVFDQSDQDGRVMLLRETPPESLTEAVREAAYCCPAGAITLTTP